MHRKPSRALNWKTKRRKKEVKRTNEPTLVGKMRREKKGGKARSEEDKKVQKAEELFTAQPKNFQKTFAFKWGTNSVDEGMFEARAHRVTFLHVAFQPLQQLFNDKDGKKKSRGTCVEGWEGGRGSALRDKTRGVLRERKTGRKWVKKAFVLFLMNGTKKSFFCCCFS